METVITFSGKGTQVAHVVSDDNGFLNKLANHGFEGVPEREPGTGPVEFDIPRKALIFRMAPVLTEEEKQVRRERLAANRVPGGPGTRKTQETAPAASGKGGSKANAPAPAPAASGRGGRGATPAPAPEPTRSGSRTRREEPAAAPAPAAQGRSSGRVRTVR